jgi:hypothetical protein
MKKNSQIRRAIMAANQVMFQLNSDGKLKTMTDALGIPKEPAGQMWKVNREGILWFREFVKNGGLQLEPTYWRLENDAIPVLSSSIEKALINGWDAYKAAANFISEGTVNNIVHTQIGPPDYDQIDEVFQSLINLGHGSAYMVGAQTTLGFGGFKYLLSPRHTEADICDLLATQNLYGLGNGVYPNAAECPWPAHPGTLSYVVLVFKNEITDADRDSKETSLQGLSRLPSEVRQGVLGVTKAKYFDQGLLKSWMIRSSLKAVQSRLVRLGLLDGNTLEKDPEPYEDEEEYE